MIALKFLSVLLAGYLLGSIPFGLLVSRHMAKRDIRRFGSGKIGATNVLRVVGKKAAALVALGDILKGAAAVLAAGFIFRGEYAVAVGSPLWWTIRSAPVLGALAAMAGHNWSIFLRFRGGRGVATFFGGLAALSPAVAIFSGEVVFLGAGMTRFVSVGSMAGAFSAFSIMLPLTLVNGFPIEYLVYCFVGTVAIVIMHRDNIARLLAGKERRLGEKAEPVSSPSEEGNL